QAAQQAQHAALLAQQPMSSAGILRAAPSLFPTQETQPPKAFSTMTLQDHKWNMDTGASSHLNSHSSKAFLTRHILLICDSLGDLYPVTKPSTTPSAFLYVSPTTWHQRLGHPGEEVLHSLVYSNFISCNKEKPSHLCHACQLGKHVRLSFSSSDSNVSFIKSATIRTVLSLALSRKWPIHQLDVKNAFLNADLSKTFYSISHLVLWVLVFHIMTPVDTEPNLGPDGVLICLFMHDPREPYLSALKRILWYVRGTLDFGLQLYASSSGSLVAYYDVDWDGFPSTHRSTSGYCVFFRDNLISWSSKRQHTLSRSSAKAEYQGVVNAVAETAWLRNLLLELHSPLVTATLFYCDNVSAIYLTANPVQHQRTKHIEIDIYFVRDMVSAGQVQFCMFPHATRMLTFSRRDCLRLCLSSFVSV
ncbi:ribonuclease H-like domain-containing protein, partial [Tanacetum coccineum]